MISQVSGRIFSVISKHLDRQLGSSECRPALTCSHSISDGRKCGKEGDRACGEKSRTSDGLRVGAESVNSGRAIGLNIRKKRSDPNGA